MACAKRSESWRPMEPSSMPCSVILDPPALPGAVFLRFHREFANRLALHADGEGAGSFQVPDIAQPLRIAGAEQLPSVFQATLQGAGTGAEKPGVDRFETGAGLNVAGADGVAVEQDGESDDTDADGQCIGPAGPPVAPVGVTKRRRCGQVRAIARHSRLLLSGSLAFRRRSLNPAAMGSNGLRRPGA